MRSSRGVTLVSIVVGVVIMMLISSVAVKVGTDAYSLAKEKNFIAKMKVIQSRVDQIAEKEDYIEKYADYKLNYQDSDITIMIINPNDYNIDTTNSWDETEDANIDNYYKFTATQLQNVLEIPNQDIDVLINFKTRNVIAINGVKHEGKKYYRQYDLSGGEKLY